MTSKSPHGKDGLLGWLYDRGEETLAQVVEDLTRHRALSDTVTQAVKRAAKAKGQIDHNMQAMLGLLNVPSRADYQKLLIKVETLQGSLINVNMKLDRLLAAMAAAAEKPKRRSRPPRARATHPRPTPGTRQ